MMCTDRDNCHTDYFAAIAEEEIVQKQEADIDINETIDYEVWMVYGTRKDDREDWFIQRIEKITD